MIETCVITEDGKVCGLPAVAIISTTQLNGTKNRKKACTRHANEFERVTLMGGYGNITWLPGRTDPRDLFKKDDKVGTETTDAMGNVWKNLGPEKTHE